jgi:hypothetical protein
VTNKKNVLRNKKERSNEKERKRNPSMPIEECMHRCNTTNAHFPKPINTTMTVKALTANLPT